MMQNMSTIALLILLLNLGIIFSSPIADFRVASNDQWPKNKKLGEKAAKTWLKFRDDHEIENDISKRMRDNCQGSLDYCRMVLGG